MAPPGLVSLTATMTSFQGVLGLIDIGLAWRLSVSPFCSKLPFGSPASLWMQAITTFKECACLKEHALCCYDMCHISCSAVEPSCAFQLPGLCAAGFHAVLSALAKYSISAAFWFRFLGRWLEGSRGGPDRGRGRPGDTTTALQPVLAGACWLEI